MIKFDVRYNPATISYEMYVWDIYPNDKHLLQLQDETLGRYDFVLVQPQNMAPRPTFCFDEKPQQLFDELWREGLRPSEKRPEQQDIERAMGDHIESLRIDSVRFYRLLLHSMGAGTLMRMEDMSETPEEIA